MAERLDAGLAARFGGEEFVCLLPALDENAALLFVHSQREPLSQDRYGPLMFSGGIAQWRPHEDLSELLVRGDAAMYRAKHAGRDCVMPAE